MNRTREQWAVIDAKFCATQNSATANWHLIQDAQKDIAELHRERDALLAERDALSRWKQTAEYWYGQYRLAKYGETPADHPADGALDAWHNSYHGAKP